MASKRRNMFQKNKTHLSIILGHFGNGGWKVPQSGFDMGRACTMMRTFLPHLLKKYFGEKHGIPPPYCPAPAGNYTIEDMDTRVTAFLGVWPSGVYRVDFVTTHVKTVTRVGCKRITVVVPRKKNVRG
ncbi:hypothetical protein AAG570_003050 [Ranatra chinensis]|uniref:Uncharacterized protein n=1 Tax=Ranatra chinensis TaxID=642074 RepID=A0ABD0YSE4_9HEMI